MAGIMANQNQEGYFPVLATWTDVTDQPFRPISSSPTMLLFSAHWDRAERVFRQDNLLWRNPQVTALSVAGF